MYMYAHSLVYTIVEYLHHIYIYIYSIGLLFGQNWNHAALCTARTVAAHRKQHLTFTHGSHASTTIRTAATARVKLGLGQKHPGPKLIASRPAGALSAEITARPRTNHKT